jgi:hypothetical protein
MKEQDGTILNEVKRQITLSTEDGEGYIIVNVWEYHASPEHEYFEVQTYLDGKWASKLFYSPKKVISFVRQIERAASSLPASALRVLYKSADEPAPAPHSVSASSLLSTLLHNQ